MSEKRCYSFAGTRLPYRGRQREGDGTHVVRSDVNGADLGGVTMPDTGDVQLHYLTEPDNTQIQL